MQMVSTGSGKLRNSSRSNCHEIFYFFLSCFYLAFCFSFSVLVFGIVPVLII